MLDRSSRSFEDDVLWLTDSNASPEEQQARLDADLVRNGLCYGPGPIPVWPVALVVGPGLWEQARRLARGLWECAQLLARAQDDESLRALWRLTHGEKELLAGHPPGQQPCRLLRMDCSLTGGVLRVLEINTLFSGLASADGVAECVSRLPAIAARLGAMEAELRPLTPCLAMALGAGSPGRVVLLGRPGSDPISPEYEYTLARLARLGLPDALVASPEELDPDALGYLIHAAAPVRAVYLRGSFDRWGLETDRLAHVLSAARLGRVMIVNPFASLLIDSKAAFAAMWTERFRAGLRPELRSLIEAHVPETRPLDLAEMESASRERHRWVLKPIDGYGGNGVLIGRERNSREWDEAIAVALGSRYIIQEFVAQPEVPALPGRIGKSFWNLNFVVADGELVGGFTRASISEVINIALGGAMLPIFTPLKSGTGQA